MSLSPFTPMKRIEIVIEGSDLPALREMLIRCGASGFTVLRDVAGLGQHGWRDGKMMFNDQASLAMVVAVVPEASARAIAEELALLFRTHPGVTFFSDVAVLRAERFAAPA